MSTINIEKIIWRWVNLSHREDRRQHMAKELAKAGIEAERFEALRFEDYDGPEEDVRLMMPTKNTIGQWLSMMALWKTVSGKDQILGMLEDDVMICSDFMDRLRYIEEHFDKPWDIFFLGATVHVGRAVWHPEIGCDCEPTGIPHIFRVWGAFSNQGMLTNGNSAEKILEMMEERKPESTGSDHALIQIQPKLNCYCFIPGMVFQIDSESDIGHGITRFSDFRRSLGEYVWADRLEDFDYDAWAKDRACWIACEHIEPHWVPERRFGLPSGILRNKKSGLARDLES